MLSPVRNNGGADAAAEFAPSASSAAFFFFFFDRGDAKKPMVNEGTVPHGSYETDTDTVLVFALAIIS